MEMRCETCGLWEDSGADRRPPTGYGVGFCHYGPPEETSSNWWCVKWQRKETQATDFLSSLPERDTNSKT